MLYIQECRSSEQPYLYYKTTEPGGSLWVHACEILEDLTPTLSKENLTFKLTEQPASAVKHQPCVTAAALATTIQSDLLSLLFSGTLAAQFLAAGLDTGCAAARSLPKPHKSETIHCLLVTLLSQAHAMTMTQFHSPSASATLLVPPAHVIFRIPQPPCP